MSINRQIAIWLLFLICFVVILMTLSEVLFPFLAGLAIAYCFDPAADALERLGLSRLLSALTVTIVTMILFLAFILLLFPLILNELSLFLDKIPEYAEIVRTKLLPLINKAREKLEGAGIVSNDQAMTFTQFFEQGRALAQTIIVKAIQSGALLINFISLFVVTPIIAFYILLDWDRMMGLLRSWLPRQHEETIVGLFKDMDRAVGGFFRGQLMVALILGCFYAVTLSLLDLRFALLIGLIAGLLGFIPYVGTMTGFVISTFTAVGQFWPEYQMVLAVVAVFGVGQVIEGNFLQPKLVGKNTGLHPVWLMFSLVVFGYLFGFIGLLIAVPLSASFAVLVRFGLKKYLQSPLYLGDVNASLSASQLEHLIEGGEEVMSRNSGQVKDNES